MTPTGHLSPDERVVFHLVEDVLRDAGGQPMNGAELATLIARHLGEHGIVTMVPFPATGPVPSVYSRPSLPVGHLERLEQLTEQVAELRRDLSVVARNVSANNAFGRERLAALAVKGTKAYAETPRQGETP
jgi:hypothetical protein